MAGCHANTQSDIDEPLLALLCEPGFDFLRGDETMDNPSSGQIKGAVPDCSHLHIHEWLELIDVLEGTR